MTSSTATYTGFLSTFFIGFIFVFCLSIGLYKFLDIFYFSKTKGVKTRSEKSDG